MPQFMTRRYDPSGRLLEEIIDETEEAHGDLIMRRTSRSLAYNLSRHEIVETRETYHRDGAALVLSRRDVTLSPFADSEAGTGSFAVSRAPSSFEAVLAGDFASRFAADFRRDDVSVNPTDECEPEPPKRPLRKIVL